MYGIKIKKWNGETCWHCGKDLHSETFVMDENYFCCEHCLGAYLVEQHEDEYDMVDFQTEEEILESQREDWDDFKKDEGYW